VAAERSERWTASSYWFSRKQNRLVREVFSPVADSRVLRQAAESLANLLLEAVSGFNVVLGNE